MVKTNALRMLDKERILYKTHTYEVDEHDLSGTSTAKKLHINAEQMFKTLVVKNTNQEIFVCCIPVAEELDLKKVAKITSSKHIEMLPVKELLNTCGYVRGSCSPIGMKKAFPTYVDETCILFDTLFISAGMKGMMIEISPITLISFINANCMDLCKG